MSLFGAELSAVPLGDFEQDPLGLLLLVVLGQPPHRLVSEEPGDEGEDADDGDGELEAIVQGIGLPGK